ncbi:MAG: endonuclease/exonuclease/phosphatase family protein [Sulfitobacter sp.]
MLTEILSFVIYGFAGLLLVASLLPLSKLPHGAIRGLAFPREQFFCMAAVLAVLAPFVLNGSGLIAALAVLTIVALIQLVYIMKFTPLWDCQSGAAQGDILTREDSHISLLTANVKKSNRDYDRLIILVRDKSPDVVMAIEVDDEWITALEAGLGAQFPHWINVPMENGYGLCVMSRLALTDSHTEELVTEGVPSIRTAVTLRDGQKLRLYVVHPEPPVVNHDTIGRDSEIALIGMQAAKDALPAIVTGDLNDVAWSTTTRRFQRLSGLADPRVGRGFYNTFSAFTIFMRWPLDHLFHDQRFRLIGMARMPHIGSDHFPMLFKLALTARARPGDVGEIEPEERREVQEMIAQERARPREAIGSDWEDEPDRPKE